MRVGQRALGFVLGRVRELITGELFGDETVKWLVGVEGANDVIAILVGVAARRIGVAVAVRVRVTRGVEPVAAPAFAVMRGVEQPVDQPFVGVGRGVREEGLDLGGRRRQPGEVQAGAAQQRDLFGVGREAESLLRQRVHQERIDRRAGAVFGFRRRDLRLANRLERPEGALFLGDAAALAQVGWLGACSLRAGGNPLLDQRQLFAGELLVALRHFAAVNHFEKQAPLGLAGDEDRSVVAALEHQPAQAQVEAGFQLLAFAVTFEAMRLEDRADVLLERRWSGDDDGRGSKQQPADQRGNLVRVHLSKSTSGSQKERARNNDLRLWYHRAVPPNFRWRTAGSR